MAVEVIERFESRVLTAGRSPSAELRFLVQGTNSDADAMNAVLNAAPTEYDPWGSGVVFLPRESVRLEPVGDKLWEAVVTYGPTPETGSSSYAFETGGGTQHIIHTLQTVGAYAPEGQTAPPTHGLIGVTPDGVEGVDIEVPVYEFSETHYLPDSQVTNAYKALIYNLTGKVNNATFKGFAPGEVLFLGATGSQRGSGDWEITFRFAASPNATNFPVGNITVASKKGWEYMWIRHEEAHDETTGLMVRRPRAVYVERVRRDADLNQLGI